MHRCFCKNPRQTDSRLSNSEPAYRRKLQEQNLDIDFASHWADILEQKKVVDYVQVDNFTAVGAEIDLSAILPADTPISDGTTKGVIVEAPLNKCVVRDGINW